MGWFEKWLATRYGEEKLYKFVYDQKVGRKDQVLLVVGRSPVEATKKFYETAGVNNVLNILEFTEIKYGSGDVENE